MTLAALRADVARLEGRAPSWDAQPDPAAWTWGSPALGALERDAVHELTPSHAGAIPSALSLAWRLLSRLQADATMDRGDAIIWVQSEAMTREVGLPYGPGLAQLGFDPARLLLVRVRDAAQGLWALEEALRARAGAAVVGCGLAVEFTPSRRLSLACAQARTPLLLLDERPAPLSSAASRWQVAPQPGPADLFDPRAPGAPRWQLSASKRRQGMPGTWCVEWNDATHHFDLVADVAVGAQHRSTGAPALSPRYSALAA
jgi:protein ImuA